MSELYIILKLDWNCNSLKIINFKEIKIKNKNYYKFSHGYEFKQFGKYFITLCKIDQIENFLNHFPSSVHNDFYNSLIDRPEYELLFKIYKI